jgi:putative transcriptional regulator
MDTLEGHLLLASPELQDPNFFHSVVLLLRHNDEGAFGLVLNRPLQVRLHDIWQQISSKPAQRNDLVFLGGPCEGPLMALHDDPTLSESEGTRGIHFCSDRDLLTQLAAAPERQVKFFVGFSGWGPGQLEGELDEGSWLTLPAVAANIFDAHDDLWDRVLRDVHGRQLLDRLHIRHVPPDLRMN